MIYMYILYEKSMHGNINVILETVCVKLQVWAGNHPKRKQLLIRKLIRCMDSNSLQQYFRSRIAFNNNIMKDVNTPKEQWMPSYAITIYIHWDSWTHVHIFSKWIYPIIHIKYIIQLMSGQSTDHQLHVTCRTQYAI